LQGGAAGDHDPEFTAKGFPPFVENQPAGYAQPELVKLRVAGQPEPQSQVDSPEENLLFQPWQVLTLVDYIVIDLFKQPWHRVGDVGPDLPHGLCNDGHVLKIVDASTLVLEVVVHHPLIHMTQRQKTQGPVSEAEIMGCACSYSIGNQIIV